MVSLMTPGLITEVAEAVEDYQVTAQEFGEIIEVVTSIFMGVVVAGFVAMLMRAVTGRFGEETGVPIPIVE